MINFAIKSLLFFLTASSPTYSAWFTSDGKFFEECMENRRSDIQNEIQLKVAEAYCRSKHPYPPIRSVGAEHNNVAQAEAKTQSDAAATKTAEGTKTEKVAKAVAEEAAEKARAEGTVLQADRAARLESGVLNAAKAVDFRPQADAAKVGDEQRMQAEIMRLLEKKKAKQKAQTEQTSADEASAIVREVSEYKAKIIAKVRRNIVMQPDIPYNVTAEFYVTLLPSGMVLKAELTKPSGSAAYDSAVERAIKKAEPLPLPPDVTLFDMFRELRISFCP